MTICIAAIGKYNESEIIVFATDHMISVQQIGQFEHSIEKFKKITHTTIAMLSGEALRFEDLLDEVYDETNFDEAKKKIHKNMVKLREDMIQKQLLDIYKIDYNYLKELLRIQLANPYTQGMLDFITKFTLKTNVLLIGFKDKKAQIVEITERDMVNMRDINFGAIGSGGTQAINTLLFQKHSKNDNLETTIYNVYKAKRNAEVSVGVGKETDTLVLTKSGMIKLGEGQIKLLADIYEEELKYGKTNDKLGRVIGFLGFG
ncbi:MAG: hypothetical protein J4428_05185 [Candidatus Aenigmarchaeota archaeon]|nr:hypothetical protein [Candidatus Aenigmarchaeota archaeon]